MEEIKQLKNIMNELEITELKQLCNEIDSMNLDCPHETLTEYIESFLCSKEAEIAIQIYFNKEEYDEFISNGKTAVEQLKESFGL